jgi:hypothetical protein
VIKSFFLKRSFEIGFQESKQYLDLSVGVSGEIDPETGMILNLSVLDSWFQDFRSKERAQTHENMLAFYETAKIFFQSKTKSLFALLEVKVALWILNVGFLLVRCFKVIFIFF